MLLRVNGFLVFTAAESVAGGDVSGQPNVGFVGFWLAGRVVQRDGFDAELFR